jgi:hypothetical protein
VTVTVLVGAGLDFGITVFVGPGTDTVLVAVVVSGVAVTVVVGPGTDMVFVAVDSTDVPEPLVAAAPRMMPSTNAAPPMTGADKHHCRFRLTCGCGGWPGKGGWVRDRRTAVG